MAEPYSIRAARLDEQRELTQLCVRATLHTGYDEAFVDRVMPGLTVTVPLIASGYVQVAERKSGEVIGLVTVTPTALKGVAMLHALFVEPEYWRTGAGRMLFDAALVHAAELKAGALMIHSEPAAEGFYKRMGAIRIGEAPFVLSPEVTIPQLLHIIPREQPI